MIAKIRVQNFRNLPDIVFEFSPKTNIIVGPNAAGKTNLLESIYLLSNGKSFKARHESEIIKNNQLFGRIKGLIDEGAKLEITIGKNKKFLVNGVSKRLFNFAGNLKTVLFRPEDLDLVTASPYLRRKFLDTVLSLTDKEYGRNILSYEKGVRQRNKLLFKIRNENLSTNQLIFWDQLLINNGDYIAQKREEFINFINETPNPSISVDYNIFYDKSLITKERLEKYKNAEIASAKTLIGPHRDDFIFQDKERNLASFGSRGEQRMAVLWLKVAELKYIKHSTNDFPTLLLDDIFSELDEKHREIVFDIAKNQQTIITTADPDFIKDFDVDSKITLG